MKKDERYRRLLDLGCIVCLENGVWTPPEIHHPYGRKNNGDMNTYPLCFWHHREGSNIADYTSRHPYKAAFEARYGTDEELLEKTNKLIK